MLFKKISANRPQRILEQHHKPETPCNVFVINAEGWPGSIRNTNNIDT